MNEIVAQLLAALVGSFGFAMVFGLHRRYLVPAALGSMMVWAVYLGVHALIGSDFLSCLIASAFAVLYAEVLAHVLKTPASLLSIPAIFPLVPGSTLYYAMSYAVRGEMEEARAYGAKTLLFALAIAAGISFVMACRELRTKR